MTTPQIYQMLDAMYDTEDVDADGNCLPRVYARHFLGDQKFHRLVRKKGVQVLRKYAVQLSPFVDGDYNEFCDRMERDGEWCGELMIVALTVAFKTPTSVYDDSGDFPLPLSYPNAKLPLPVDALVDMTKEPISILRSNEVHFEYLMTKDQPETSPTNSSLSTHESNEEVTTARESEDDASESEDEASDHEDATVGSEEEESLDFMSCKSDQEGDSPKDSKSVGDDDDDGSANSTPSKAESDAEGYESENEDDTACSTPTKVASHVSGDGTDAELANKPNLLDSTRNLIRQGFERAKAGFFTEDEAKEDPPEDSATPEGSSAESEESKASSHHTPSIHAPVPKEIEVKTSSKKGGASRATSSVSKSSGRRGGASHITPSKGSKATKSSKSKSASKAASTKSKSTQKGATTGTRQSTKSSSKQSSLPKSKTPPTNDFDEEDSVKSMTGQVETAVKHQKLKKVQIKTSKSNSKEGQAKEAKSTQTPTHSRKSTNTKEKDPMKRRQSQRIRNKGNK